MNQRLPALLRSFRRLSVLSLSPSPLTQASLQIPALEIDGGIVPAAGVIQLAQAIQTGAQSGAGGLNFQTSAGATLTITSFGNLWQRLTNGGAVTVTFDSAYNAVLQIPGAFNGLAFPFDISSNAATTVATPTLSDTAITLAGTTTLLAAAWRRYVFQITQMTSNIVMPFTAGSTFTSLTQVGTTNNFTVALGTNALSPTVGTLFPITVTAGTLPSGYYPINKVTSATSFVIATPAGTVWTATAATLSFGGAVVPQVYSPLVTITGVAATVTATMSV